MKTRYTKKQIVESIAKWSTYMLDNEMISEDELKRMVGSNMCNLVLERGHKLADAAVKLIKKNGWTKKDALKPDNLR